MQGAGISSSSSSRPPNLVGNVGHAHIQVVQQGRHQEVAIDTHKLILETPGEHREGAYVTRNNDKPITQPCPYPPS